MLLEQLYEISFEKINFLERKKSIEYNYTIIKGSPKSGKSYLIYDHLSKYKTNEYLYIDFDDYKVNKDEIIPYLQDFINKHNIIVLVLENLDFDITLPKINSILITTKTNLYFDNFKILTLMPLDFEEFILFDTKHQNILNSFNNYLKYGNATDITEYNENKKQKRNYEICKLYCQNELELEILFLLIKSMSEKKSIFQLFNQLKKTHKISKDRFYNTIEQFKNNNLIFFCKKYKQPKAVKKLYIFNHSLLDIVTYKKNFNNQFKNMVFLELYNRFKDIYFLDNIDFYLPNENIVILAIPFFNDLLWNKFAIILLEIISNYNIQKIDIITISSEQIIYLENMEVNIMPFYNWVLGQ